MPALNQYLVICKHTGLNELLKTGTKCIILVVHSVLKISQYAYCQEKWSQTLTRVAICCFELSEKEI